MWRVSPEKRRGFNWRRESWRGFNWRRESWRRGCSRNYHNNSSGSCPAPTTTTTTTLPPAVFINNQLPDVSPGEAEVYVNNQPITTDLTVENRSSGTLIADNLKIEFNFSCTENCEYEDSKPKLEIEQDGIIDITTGGFEPGSEVNIWLFSEPKLLGTFIADEAGQ